MKTKMFVFVAPRPRYPLSRPVLSHRASVRPALGDLIAWTISLNPCHRRYLTPQPRCPCPFPLRCTLSPVPTRNGTLHLSPDVPCPVLPHPTHGISVHCSLKAKHPWHIALAVCHEHSFLFCNTAVTTTLSHEHIPSLLWMYEKRVLHPTETSCCSTTQRLSPPTLLCIFGPAGCGRILCLEDLLQRLVRLSPSPHFHRIIKLKRLAPVFLFATCGARFLLTL